MFVVEREKKRSESNYFLQSSIFISGVPYSPNNTKRTHIFSLVMWLDTTLPTCWLPMATINSKRRNRSDVTTMLIWIHWDWLQQLCVHCCLVCFGLSLFVLAFRIDSIHVSRPTKMKDRRLTFNCNFSGKKSFPNKLSVNLLQEY